MVERLGEMRKGRRERIEKGSRERIEKRERDHEFEEKEGLIECIIKEICHGVKQNAKYVPLVKQNVMKFEVFILGGQIIDQKRKMGWWRGRRERIENGSRERIEIERKET